MGANLTNINETSDIVVENQENTAVRVDEQSIFKVDFSTSDITGAGAVSKTIEKLIEPILMKKRRKEFERTLNMIDRYKQNGQLTSDMSYSINGIENKLIIEDRAIRSLVVEEINKQENIESIARKCLGYIDKDLIQEEEIDDDWLYTFRDSVKNISSEELQAIWAKLLANEIQSPSSYSLRTLNTLKNMSSSEAEKFKQFVKLTVEDRVNLKRIVTNDLDILGKYGIEYLDIKLLEEIGLIQEGLTVNLPPKGYAYFFIDNNRLLNIANNTENDGDFGIYNTTLVGTELASIVMGLDNSVNLNCIKEFMRKIFEDNGWNVEIDGNYSTRG